MDKNTKDTNSLFLVPREAEMGPMNSLQSSNVDLFPKKGTKTSLKTAEAFVFKLFPLLVGSLNFILYLLFSGDLVLVK